MTTMVATPAPAGRRVRRHEWLHVLRTTVRTPRGMVGMLLTMLVVGVAIIGPFVKPHSSTEFVTPLTVGRKHSDTIATRLSGSRFGSC